MEIEGASPNAENSARSDRRTYEVEGNRIQVDWKEFLPSKAGSRDEGIIFLPGWSAGTAKTLEYLAGRFAEDAGRKVLSITTRAEKVVPDSLYQEAKAVRQLIKERGLKKIILAGHSEGGAKAVDLVDVLQRENPDVSVDGLVLLDPVGLYEQGKLELAGKFSQDTAVTGLVAAPVEAKRRGSWEPIIRSMQAGTDIVFNIAREIHASKLRYPNRLWSQIAEMARRNTHYQDVKCPVILIQGAQDPVSSAERVIPKAVRDEIASNSAQRAAEARARREALSADDSTFAERWPQNPEWRDERRKILQETFFPNSPRVDMLVPKKVGRHGLPHFRSDEVARTSLYLLNKDEYRQNHPPKEQPPQTPPQSAT